MMSSKVTLLTMLLPLIAAQTYPITPYVNQTIIYETAYIDICPTGITTKTYTITQTCTKEACHKPTESVIPPHFVVTTKVCDACAGQPTVTVTCPIAVETGVYTNGTTPCYGKGCPAPPPAPTVTQCVGCPGEGAKTTPAVPTKTAAGCGSGVTCPPPGNGTYVTGGADGKFVSSAEVLALSMLVGIASSILLL
ncbi:hypothetical protein ONS95_002296 [Cadophora gregata]|uniref:uncharacterized protein n=1 Tax=Cadophora gregata TaxID=51156 RepID=UPI0026DDA32C|nr:uncharacterized protein ONS95_002296 [Cadophora gregata]KAK0109614.1 hypothetical protein ONS95_002296 [Cadophora gregata]KAK0110756.1 hypothetical protein ONS96_002354 [Cadophora gregata f. sp. sojae]